MSDREGTSAEPLVEPLTRREREILGMLAQGHSAPEIAAHLNLAVSSVKWYIQQLYGKLGVNSKQRAILRAGGLGLLGAGVEPQPVEAAQARPRHNLPLQLTNFIGRTQQIAEVRRLLRSARLLTFTGSGGTGKTRLALQIAVDTLEDFPDGAWLVELAPIVEPELVSHAVAQALAVRAETADSFEAAPVDYSGRDVVLHIVEHLGDKRLLLILDNCEHLVGACAQLAEQLLRAAPGLRILATSREALGVTGEHRYPVPALSVPDLSQLPSLETLAQSEAVRLFVERASAVRPDFALTEQNAPAVAQTCRRLEGVPLALELAAALIEALSVEQIAAHLDDRFRLLTGGSRTAPPRQQTLRGAIDWSYDLLSEAERRLLRRLSVFAGGWTLEAAEHVAGVPEALDLLTQLVAKSLVLSDQPPGQPARFRMLETIREYAQERLALAGEAESVRGRHLDYYLALAEEAELELRGRDQAKWLNRLKRENDNLRAALAWAVKTEDSEAAVRMAGALTYFWAIRSHDAEGRRWLEAALHLRSSHATLGPSAWQARALLGAGWLDREKDLSVSRARLEEGLDIYQELGDKAGMAYGLYLLGSHSRVAQRDNTRALGYYQKALELWMAAEDDWGIGICLHWMGHVAEEMGDPSKARDHFQRSYEILRKVGDPWQWKGPMSDIFRYSWEHGDAAYGRAILEKNLAVFKELGDEGSIIVTLHHLYWNSAWQCNFNQAAEDALSILKTTSDPIEAGAARVLMGHLHYQQGMLVEARAHFEAALKTFRELDAQNMIGWLLPWLGCVAYRAGDLDQARALMEQGRALLSLGQRGELSITLLNLGDVAQAQAETRAAAEYYTLSLGIAVEHRDQRLVGHLLECFAKLSAFTGQPQRAALLLGAAEALRKRIGTPIPPVERPDYDEAVALVHTQLDPAASTAAWAEGRTWGWEQAAAFALETSSAKT